VKTHFPNSLEHTNRWNSQSQNMFCYFYSIFSGNCPGAKIANYCWSENRSGDIFLQWKLKNGWLLKNFFNLIDFLVNSGSAWSKILQCQYFARSCSVCSKVDDCFESLFNEAKRWGPLHHHHFWYFFGDNDNDVHADDENDDDDHNKKIITRGGQSATRDVFQNIFCKLFEN